MKRKIISGILTLSLIFAAAFSAYGAESRFPDVADDSWACEYINELVDTGAINGYPDGTFKPDDTITVAEFIKIALVLATGSEIAPTDEEYWASGYFQFVEDMFGIAVDREGRSEPIYRNFMSTLTALCMTNIMGLDMSVDEETGAKIEAHFSDWEEVCSNCQQYVKQLYAAGIVDGFPDGTFKDGETATRAQAAAMLIRMTDASRRLTPNYDAAPASGEAAASEEISPAAESAQGESESAQADGGQSDAEENGTPE